MALGGNRDFQLQRKTLVLLRINLFKIILRKFFYNEVYHGFLKNKIRSENSVGTYGLPFISHCLASFFMIKIE